MQRISDEILEKIMADPGPGVVVFGRLESPLEVLSRENWWERACFQKFSDPVYGAQSVDFSPVAPCSQASV